MIEQQFNDPNKSIVAYYPSFAIEDPKIWTSLCLFHDQVLLFEPWLEEAGDYIIEHVSSFFRNDRRLAAVKSFRKGPLKILSSAGIISVIDLGKYLDLFSKFTETYVEVVKERISSGKCETTYDAIAPAMAYTFSTKFNIPIVSDIILPESLNYDNANKISIELSAMLARCAISKLSLPEVQALDAEDVLEAREGLKDELLEFKAGILRLTWLLHEIIEDREHFDHVQKKIDFLIQTKIKGSLISLENRMKDHENKKIKRLLASTARILLHAVKLFLPGGVEDKLISGAKSIFQLATEITSDLEGVKLPEDQIATYLYQVRTRLSR